MNTPEQNDYWVKHLREMNKSLREDTVATTTEDEVVYVSSGLAEPRTYASNVSATDGETLNNFFVTIQSQTLGDFMEQKTKRQEILETAIQYVSKDRNSTYGEPEDNFDCIAEFWSTYINRRFKIGGISQIALDPADVGLLLDLMKTARLIANPSHLDSYIDKAGYSACSGEIATRGTK